MPGRFGIDLVFTPLPAVVARGFFIAAERLRQMEEPMRRAAEVITEEVRANFDAEGRPSRWKELAESTVKRKQREGLDPRILRATGALYEGLTQGGEYDLGSWLIGEESEGWVATLEDPTGYGWRHISEHRFMPIRDWSYIPDDAIDRIEQVFYEWLEEAFESVGT